MSGLIDQIRPKLLEGFELEFFKAGRGKGMHRLLKNGQPYREKGLKYIVINDDDNYVYRRRSLKKLEEVGAIEPHWAESKPKERDLVVRSMPTKSDFQTAFERATKVLNDPKSDPTSRGLARDYIKLARLHVKVVKQLQGRKPARSIET